MFFFGALICIVFSFPWAGIRNQKRNETNLRKCYQYVMYMDRDKDTYPELAECALKAMTSRFNLGGHPLNLPNLTERRTKEKSLDKDSQFSLVFVKNSQEIGVEKTVIKITWICYT